MLSGMQRVLAERLGDLAELDIPILSQRTGYLQGITNYSRLSPRRDELRLGFGERRGRCGPYSSRRRRSPTWKRSFSISIRPPSKASAIRGKLPVDNCAAANSVSTTFSLADS